MTPSEASSSDNRIVIVVAWLGRSSRIRRRSLRQPAIARLEKGEDSPGLATLARLTRATGLTFRVDIANGSAGLVAV
ncbi:hypothetical protein SAMN06264365_112135 [Actinoplanes regularis]|uniref:Helix-turn-helix n=1 Tax=Actinoplanes regularis TaxID=52697 RepID=A0A239CWS9_9ACTN|nr:hypothetical protein Are01nite_50100 [Actinoplanes regularis]SNS24517.1 hypothetical protein SAMN06264365_112135 [Actinoplanes regularis]